MRARGTLPLLAALAALAASTGATLAAFSATTGNAGSTFATASSFSSCPNTTVTAAYLTGLEYGVSPFNSNQNIQLEGGAAIDATIKRTGGYSLKTAPSASSAYAWWNITGQPTTQVARFALRLAALPASDNQLFMLNSQGNLIGRYIASTRRLTITMRASSGSTPVVATSDVQLEAGRWHVIEVRYRVAAPTHIADWRIDGSPQPSISVAASTSTSSMLTLGTASSGTSSSFHANFDDIAISNDPGVYPLGDGRVHALLPDGISTAAAAGVIKDDDGTDADALSWQRLDEVPMLTTADFIHQTAANANAYVDVGLTDTTATCIRMAHGYYSTHSAQHNSNRVNDVDVVAVDGTRESPLLAGSTLSTTTLPRDGSAPITPASGWSQSALNGLFIRFGRSTSVANETPKLDSVLVEYEVPQ